jgi:hypothetical protein
MRRKKVRCASCGRNRIHHGRQRCDSCYQWHQLHGWDVERPKLRTVCAGCGQVWQLCGGYKAYGRCAACHAQARKDAGLMSLERYCRCGDKLRIVIPKDEKDAALDAWHALHRGAQCRPATRTQAARATNERKAA